MKKNYSKPDILFEDFSLSTNIAAGCESKVDTQAKNECGILFDPQILFDNTVSNCTRILTDGKNEFNNLCYHVPYDSMNAFYS